MDRLRSFWNENQFEKADKAWSFYCPQCKTPRKIRYSPQPTTKHYLQIGLTAAFFMLVTWSWFQWKGIVSFLPLWIAFEVVYRMKVRAALNCDRCGFDPMLYLVDVKRARREIEDHWRKKFEEKGIPYPSDSTPLREPADSLKKSPDPIARP